MNGMIFCVVIGKWNLYIQIYMDMYMHISSINIHTHIDTYIHHI